MPEVAEGGGVKDLCWRRRKEPWRCKEKDGCRVETLDVPDPIHLIERVVWYPRSVEQFGDAELFLMGKDRIWWITAEAILAAPLLQPSVVSSIEPVDRSVQLQNHNFLFRVVDYRAMVGERTVAVRKKPVWFANGVERAFKEDVI